MDYTLWMNIAKSKIKSLYDGQTFLLKDLFCGADWENLRVGERLSLGKHFKNAVMEKEFTNIAYLGKADNNSAKYKKTKDL